MSSSSAAFASWSRGLSGVPSSSLIFAVLCLLALLAVVCGALFEIGRVRREGESGNVVIGRGQFGWRMASALVWCVALGLLAYASSWGWPRQKLALGLDARTWLQVLAVAMMLIFVGLMLLAHDLWRVKARSAAQEAAFHAGLSLIAQQEIERAKNLPKSENPSP
jgi:hypothetical protein